MKYYDVIIVGGGIAGTGLAYNLKRIGYKGSILLIERKELGSNAAYGYRILFRDIIDEYNINHQHKYKGLKIGVNDKIHFTVKGDFFLCDYRKLCCALLKSTNITFKKEEALGISKNIIKTNKSNYRFNYLIDCSGTNFFLKRKFHKQLSFRYWLGHVRVLKKNIDINDDYLYYLFDDSGYMEDFYPFKDKIMQGDWQYTKTMDFSLIKPPQRTFLKKVQNQKVLKQFFVIDPVTPILPLVYKNYGFLGDSFGNAVPSSGVGIGPALDSSRILSIAIKKNELKFYERTWKKRYLNSYIISLTSRLDRYHTPKILKYLKNYPKNTEVLKLLKINPQIMVKLLKNDNNFKFPDQIKQLYPRHQKLFLAFYYLLLKLKYSLQ